MDVVRVQKLLNLKEFGGDVTTTWVDPRFHGKFVSFMTRSETDTTPTYYIPEEKSCFMVDVTNPRERCLVPTLQGVHPSVSPSGKLAVSMMDVVSSLVIYDIKTKKKINAHRFDLDYIFIKWITATSVAVVTSTEVFNWDVSKDPVKVFQRDPHIAHSPVHDYIVSDNGSWHVLVPGESRNMGNVAMQCYSVKHKKSALIDGNQPCFTSCKNARGHTVPVLCYNTMQNVRQSVDIVNTVELDAEFAFKSVSKIKIRLPIKRFGDSEVVIALYASVKHLGLVFLFGGFGTLCLLRVESGECLQQCQVGHSCGYFLRSTLSVETDDLLVMKSNGDVFRAYLDETGIQGISKHTQQQQEAKQDKGRLPKLESKQDVHQQKLQLKHGEQQQRQQGESKELQQRQQAKQEHQQQRQQAKQREEQLNKQLQKHEEQQGRRQQKKAQQQKQCGIQEQKLREKQEEHQRQKLEEQHHRKQQLHQSKNLQEQQEEREQQQHQQQRQQQEQQEQQQQEQGVQSQPQQGQHLHGYVDQEQIEQAVNPITSDTTTNIIACSTELAASATAFCEPSSSGIDSLSYSGETSSNLGEKKQCIICYENDFNAVLIPCGHLWFCFQCATDIKRENRPCPACRANVDAVVRVYMPE